MPAYKDEKTGKWFAKFYYTNWQGIKKQKWKRLSTFIKLIVCVTLNEILNSTSMLNLVFLSS